MLGCFVPEPAEGVSADAPAREGVDACPPSPCRFPPGFVLGTAPAGGVFVAPAGAASAGTAVGIPFAPAGTAAGSALTTPAAVAATSTLFTALGTAAPIAPVPTPTTGSPT